MEHRQPCASPYRQPFLRSALHPDDTRQFLPTIEMLQVYLSFTDAWAAERLPCNLRNTNKQCSIHCARAAVQARPSLAVTRPLLHPWVDQAGAVTFSSLLNWSPSQSALLAVVAEALSELQGSQPPSSHCPAPPPPRHDGAANFHARDL